ncbi:hypothetical protein ACFXI8_26365 [Streptomyces niveus]|uniref:hypothetical protein n=1 Tax=Streptomyces niveus TaxID=193462 RepID=UPI0036A14C95
MTTTLLDVDDCLAHVEARTEVVGISRCGSYRMGIEDPLSDLDVWVFCTDETPLSESWVLDTLLPAHARQEALFEGRDDSLTEHLVVNLLTPGVVLNLKVLRLRTLARFCKRPPSLDAGYLEDLENYHTMQVLHDPEELLAHHLTRLRKKRVETVGAWLIPEIVNRYASAYWRSVYQGLLRTEEHCWRLLAGDLVLHLAAAAYLAEGQLPPARKWVLSERLLDTLPHGERITRLLKVLSQATTADRDSVFAFYRELTDGEELFLPVEHLPEGTYWWRGVFTQRLPNLAGLPELHGLHALADQAQRLFPRRGR